MGLTSNISRATCSLTFILMATACASTSAISRRPTGQASSTADEWAAYGHDVYGSRYSPLTDINRDNISRLRVAWTYHTREPLATRDMKRSLEVTPLMIGNTLYLSTPLGKIVALDPVTGTEKWKYDAKVGLHSGFGDFTTRGVSYWNGRIFMATTDGRLIAVDASAGVPIAEFGDHGTVDLRKGLRNAPFEFAEYEVTSPPAVVNGLLVVGSAVADNNRTDAASGEVRAYDARTGRLKWSWDPVPQDATDPAFNSWEGNEAHRTGAANAWSVIAADPERDLVFVPTSSPSPDYYGGRRLGRNDYASSIVALRASTGKVVWHFQTVHHDLWDYDNASPPLLATVKGQPAVIQATKTGMMFVLNRETGTPIFPVEERAVPASTVPGERAWPTQPFSSLPALSPHRWDGQSSDTACQTLTRGLRNEGIFTPPSIEGTIVVPSNIGGAHWGGVAFDPVRQIAVVPVNRLAAAAQLIPAAGVNIDTLHQSRSRMGYDYTLMRGTPYIMRRRILYVPPATPCTPAPAAELVAIDLKSGTKAWSTAIAPNLGGAIVTAGGLVFMAATIDRQLRAFNVDTGREVWHADLPASGKATPMTYRGADGRQYVVIAAGGDGETWGASDAIIAFALPSQSAWQTAPSLLNARSAHAVVSTGDAIYAVGGTGERGAPVAGVERFDGTSWREETRLPGDGLNAPAAVAIGERIYVIGGFKTTTNVPTSDVLIYDTRSHSWSNAAPLPAPRGGHAAVVLNGKIHVIGGGNSRSTLADHSEYDPATNQWTDRAPLSRSKGSPAAVAFEGRLYSIGGRSGPADFGDVEIYDPATERWSAGPSIEPRGTAGAAAYCGTIYVFGGESQAKKATLGDVLRLNAKIDGWEPAEPMPSPRNYARAVVFNDAAYLVGGNPTVGMSHSSTGSSLVEKLEGCGRG